MNDLKITLEKQGGIKLLKQYWRSGVFFTAIGEFFLLGKSRTSLEILRLSTQLKVKQKLKKKYRDELIKFDKNYRQDLSHEKGDKIWICWFQGIENAPDIVKKCFQSIKENLKNREIILITSENLADYVEIPDFILTKWENGQITDTHMTDLLRLELLIRYGGMWLDATVFCTDQNIPDYYFDSDLFLYQCLKPGRDGHSHLISSWLMSAKTNNKVLMAVRHLCYVYWKNNTEMVDYFLLHDFISIVLEYYPDEWKKIVPISNSTPHILLLRLFEPYDEFMWNAIKSQTPFHKMTYKFKKEQTEITGTYYKLLFG